MGFRTRVFVLALLAVIGAAALLWDALLAHAMSGVLHMNDFGKFYYSTQAFLEHGDMYAPGPATELPNEALKGFQFLNLNPPHFHLLVVPFALLSPSLAIGAWMVVSLSCAVLSILLIAREVGLAWTPLRLLLVAAAGASFAGTQAFFVTGQLSFLLLLAMTLAWRAARRGAFNAAGAWIGACASVKPFLLLFVPYLLLNRQWKALGMVCASAAAWCLIGVCVFGPESYRSWIAALQHAGDWSWASMNASAQGFFSRVFAASPYFEPLAVSPPGAGWWVPFAAVVGVATMGIAAVCRSLDLAFALILVATQLMSPLGWVYYFWLPAGPLAAWLCSPVAGGGRWTGRKRVWMTVLASAPMWIPTQFTIVGQPSAWATVTIGSSYLWAATALWLWLAASAALYEREWAEFQPMEAAARFGARLQATTGALTNTPRG